MNERMNEIVAPPVNEFTLAKQHGEGAFIVDKFLTFNIIIP